MLRCKFEPKRDLIGGLSVGIKFSILEEDNQNFSDFYERFNTPSKEIEKSLIIHDFLKLLKPQKNLILR